ncbi:hypothetical protein EON66_03540, partial [archaeon]
MLALHTLAWSSALNPAVRASALRAAASSQDTSPIRSEEGCDPSAANVHGVEGRRLPNVRNVTHSTGGRRLWNGTPCNGLNQGSFSIETEDVDTVEECYQKCRETPACVAFVTNDFENELGCYYGAKRCNLKDKIDDIFEDTECRCLYHMPASSTTPSATPTATATSTTSPSPTETSSGTTTA